MPSHASTNPESKQIYVNDHFCYVFKFGIVTNSLGTISYILYNKGFMASIQTLLLNRNLTPQTKIKRS